MFLNFNFRNYTENRRGERCSIYHEAKTKLLEKPRWVWTYWKWKSLSSVRLFATPWTTKSMEFSRQNTEVGSGSLLQGIFPIQGSNPGFLRCRQIHYQLNHQGSPGILEWVAYPFSSRSSWPRNGTGVSCTAGRFFISWGTSEVKSLSHVQLWNPMDCSLPSSSVHGIFQTRVLECVAISFSRGSSRPRGWIQVSHIAGRRFTVWATREAS